MLRYVIRRVLQMIPTMFGVILITFVLFNIAGGSPAVMKLGKQATPAALEEYETERGLNKPLFWGHWGSTRAYSRVDFTMNPGPWGKVPAVVYTNIPFGRIILCRQGQYAIPMAMPLKTNDSFRWVMRYRSVGTGQGGASMVLPDGKDGVTTVAIEESSAWRSFRYEFQSGLVETNFDFRIATGGRDLEIRDLRLERKVDNVFDSQFRLCLVQVLTLDFGVSRETNQKVSEMIKGGILPSLALTVPMFIIGLLLEIIIALVCAFYRNRWIDRFFVILSVALMSVPYLVWIILGQYILGYSLRLFPVWGFESMRYLVLPCMIGIFSGLGSGIRFYRTIMLDEMYRDYVRTAFAKGVSKSGVLFRHVLKNAMIPILTSVIVAIPFLYTGSLLLESFFGIPGLGNLSINGLNNSDFDVIRTVVFIGAMLYLAASLLTDLLYALVDPRVRLQ